MTLQAFRETNFRPDTRSRIQEISDILDEYDGQKLTARQVFYQLVSRGLLDNTERTYKATTNLLTDARYAGLISWDAIEDRGREPRTPQDFENLEELVEVALNAYRLPRWRGQKVYVELWVEKQALEGVLAPIARKHHVTLMVNKGYSSASAMKASADRMRDAAGISNEAFETWKDNFNEEGVEIAEEYGLDSDKHKAHIAKGAKWLNANTREVVLLYLGDHDPSGEDMVRDIRDRLTEFGVMRLTVEKIGLTMAQIKRFNPPPNPAKITDSRAAAYIAKYGDKSWELDALPPRELNRLVEAAISVLVDQSKLEEVIAAESRDKKELVAAVAKLRGKKRK